MVYPLYDELVKLHEACDEKIDISQTCKTINDLARQLSPEDLDLHYEEIFVLILHYDSLRNEGNSLVEVPYRAKVQHGGRGVLFDMHKIPPKLQGILYQYIKFYIKS